MTDSKKKAFLEAYRECGIITSACRSAGINRDSYYRWRDTDEEFAQAAEQAEADAGDLLEAEAHRRATEGVLEPVFYQGMECGAVRKYSDTLLIFLLKGARPEKYRERQEITGKGGGPLKLTLTLEDTEAARAFLGAVGCGKE